MRIKDISEENRPRERMEKQGAKILSDSELLAVILQKGTKEEKEKRRERKKRIRKQRKKRSKREYERKIKRDER